MIDPDNDTFKYKHVHNHNPKARQELLETIDLLALKEPSARRFTWQQPTPVKQARLDYFLVSHNVYNSVERSESGRN